LNGVFSVGDLEGIMEKSLASDNKQRVVDTTMSVGAFGAPWITAIDKNGTRKDWFGNDRWDQIFYFLKVPFTPITITLLGQAKAQL
jgi:glutathione S-transferase kappa 1